MYSFAAAKIGKLYMVVLDKDIFRLNVSVEYSVFVHMVNRLENLIHIVLDFLWIEVVLTNFDYIVKVTIHQFENKR